MTTDAIIRGRMLESIDATAHSHPLPQQTVEAISTAAAAPAPIIDAEHLADYEALDRAWQSQTQRFLSRVTRAVLNCLDATPHDFEVVEQSVDTCVSVVVLRGRQAEVSDKDAHTYGLPLAWFLSAYAPGD